MLRRNPVPALVLAFLLLSLSAPSDAAAARKSRLQVQQTSLWSQVWTAKLSALTYRLAVFRCIPDRIAAKPTRPCLLISSISFLTCASLTNLPALPLKSRDCGPLAAAEAAAKGYSGCTGVIVASAQD
jgi:hypothetical protein